jgi:hypothetical protein
MSHKCGNCKNTNLKTECYVCKGTKICNYIQTKRTGHMILTLPGKIELKCLKCGALIYERK